MLVLDETSPQPREMLAAESHTAYGRLARLFCFMGGALHRCLKYSILFSGEKGTKPQIRRGLDTAGYVYTAGRTPISTCLYPRSSTAECVKEGHCKLPYSFPPASESIQGKGCLAPHLLDGPRPNVAACAAKRNGSQSRVEASIR